MKYEDAKDESAALYSKKPPLSPEETARRVQLACALSVHHSENFGKMLGFLKACGDCKSGKELEDFVVNNIADIIDAAEEVNA